MICGLLLTLLIKVDSLGTSPRCRQAKTWVLLLACWHDVLICEVYSREGQSIPTISDGLFKAGNGRNKICEENIYSPDHTQFAPELGGTEGNNSQQDCSSSLVPSWGFSSSLLYAEHCPCPGSCSTSLVPAALDMQMCVFVDNEHQTEGKFQIWGALTENIQDPDGDC